MLWLQLHYILVLHWTIIKCCTSQTNTTIYISSTNIIPPSTSNIYTTSPPSKSIWNNILQYQVDGLNLIFIIICIVLLLCTFCSVFCYFICQHSRRKGMLKKEIAANTEKNKRSINGMNGMENKRIHEGNDEKGINITMDNGTSNTMTSSIDNKNNTTNNSHIPQKHIHNNNNSNDQNFGIGSPKNQLNQTELPGQIQTISPIVPTHSHRSTDNKTPSPNRHHTAAPNNDRYSRRTTHKSHSKSPANNKEKKTGKNHTKHVQVPSNLAAEMEMASFIPMGMQMDMNKSDDNTTSVTSTDDDDDEKIGLTEHEHNKHHTKHRNTYTNNGQNPLSNKKMRSFSRRTASVDNFNKKIAYDDMAEDPELAQYAQHGDDHDSNDSNEEDSESTSESSDDSTDEEDEDDSDDDTSSQSDEGTSNESSSSDDESDESESEDGGHHDTTTGDFMQNFGNNNLLQKQVQQHLSVNKLNKSPKSKSKSNKKSPHKSPKKYEKYHGNHKNVLYVDEDSEDVKVEQEKIVIHQPKKMDDMDDMAEICEEEVADIVNPIEFRKAKHRLKKYHVADNSDAFGSYGDMVQNVLENGIDIVVEHEDEYFED